jgi:glycosyltransferase involved in cell wall biosynthesis
MKDKVSIKAANKAKFKLKIIGTGRDEEYLKSIAGPTVTFHSNISDTEFKEMYKHAKAYLFASVDEEFGIAPIEAMGYGIPVIAYKSGGVVETVKPGKNGYLYDSLQEDSLSEEIKKFESLSKEERIKMKKTARTTAETYSFEEFKKQLLSYIQKVSHKDA